MKAHCDRNKINELLESRKITWLTSKLKDMGIKIEYKHLVAMLNNKDDVEWRLSVAMGICKIFDKKINDLFILK
jgi:DNA-binding XRE family transcriptional regulator